MTNYGEILRLDSLGTNHAQISRNTGHSRKTVVRVLKKAALSASTRAASELLREEEAAVNYADMRDA